MIARLIAAAAAAGALLCAGAGYARADHPLCASGSTCRTAPLRPSPIASPAGAHAVGRVDAEIGHGARAVMVSAWYPTRTADRSAPYVPAAGPVAQLQIATRAAEWMHTPDAAGAMVGAQADATEDAAVDGDQLPVVLVSPGMGTPRFILSGLATELASRGYAVVAIDHTGESPAVQLPDGRIVWGAAPTVTPDYMRAQLATRIGDLRLVLDHLTALPIVGARLDLGRIAALGHSYGGTTAVQLAAIDARVRAAVALDGPAGWDGVAAAPALDLPVLSLDLTGMWSSSWNGFRGSRFEVASILNAGHYTATDLPAFGCSADLCGTVPADRAALVSRDVVGLWLDRWLRGMDTPRFTAPELVWQT
ncbi:alpha/beta hydrolase family protein [Nocardia africana]|uniref:Predicted dienelactone hydrolase n=1 Tax=Nocardia africana TaxID=134964 RepID=A0A378X2Y3_9NOCA|nr:alpha/beta fold hydrolase [Nocardia africana]MCC3311553.1 hypothetical protein [Nocardia africana]SUA47185.1 Predicted dienelactone hydrolase [Nocardia africana]